MENKMEVCFTIKPIWETISNIREDILKVLKLKNVNEETLEKADVVCLELLENAVKYGIVTPCMTIKICIKKENVPIYIL
jgi:anti-sigma regulatory factor (Ser/Thr protein kinase)